MEKNKQTTEKPIMGNAYTFFMVPFYYHGNEWDEIHQNKLGKWIPIKKELYNKDDVLYPYIMDYKDLKIQFRAVSYAKTNHVLEYRVDPNQDLTYEKTYGFWIFKCSTTYNNM